MMFSVLIGRVSTEDGSRILETLDALRQQVETPPYEVVLVDRLQDEISETIRTHYPEAMLIPCGPGVTLPEMRAMALDRASGEYVAVTEDHCVPTPDWLLQMRNAFTAAPPGTLAVGGCVENGVCDSALDWATFFCEYSSLIAPVPTGPATSLPGMNVAYRRSALLELDRAILLDGFWETTVHPILARDGTKLFSSDLIRILHKKKFSFGLFARQRFIYSRYYAGRRFQKGQIDRRAIAFCLSVILPALLLLRIAKGILAKHRLRQELISALPNLGVFVVIWAAGEMVGYALGAGDSLARIE